MKFSVVTVAYEAASTIERTLSSVASQDYPHLEHIVIDGGSRDGTVDIVKNRIDGNSQLVSEPDEGIYDAMNKGLALATGDVVGFLNADDFYASSSVLRILARAFEEPKIDAVYGDLCYVNREDPTITTRYWKSSPYAAGLFESGWAPPHPTFYARLDVYRRCGGFNLNYRIAADAELMMRFLMTCGIRSTYIPETLVNMRLGGTTNKSLGNIIEQNREILRALKMHGAEVNALMFLTRKMISRGRQFIAGARHTQRSE